MQAPVIIMNESTERDHGKRAQFGNIAAAKAVSDVVRTTLGPRSMLKMILDPMGGIVITNDGNAILREIDVNHPAAKSMIELSRTQDEEVGDGTTSVIILAGELLVVAEPFLTRKIHPRTIVNAYNYALNDIEDILKKQIAVKLDLTNKKQILKIIYSTIGTKFVSRNGNLICDLALKAVTTIKEDIIEASNNYTGSSSSSIQENKLMIGSADHSKDSDKKNSDKKNNDNDDDNDNKNNKNDNNISNESNQKSFGISIDVKRYARVERIPGGTLDECCVLDGVMFNKDVVHPKMRRKIVNPRIMCLDCPLEYVKGESQTDITITKGEDFDKYLQIEEDYISKICQQIIALKPDVVITEKGVSELAQHYLWKANITVLRRSKKQDNIRLARACHATIGHRIDIMKESDIGKNCGLFEVKNISDETFAFFIQCKNPKACTIILRGGSKDILQEMERNLMDAMSVTRNILLNPLVVPGGGATEMALSVLLNEKSKQFDSAMQYTYRGVATALEVIPRTLIYNCGQQPIKVLTELRAFHSGGGDKSKLIPLDEQLKEYDKKDNEINYDEELDKIKIAGDKNSVHFYGINGYNGQIVDMNQYGIWESLTVKLQTIKTAIESAAMLLRIDDVVSGIRNKEK